MELDQVQPDQHGLVLDAALRLNVLLGKLGSGLDIHAAEINVDRGRPFFRFGSVGYSVGEHETILEVAEQDGSVLFSVYSDRAELLQVSAG